MTEFTLATLRAAGIDPAHVEIRLNDQVQKNVVLFDEHRGYVDQFAMDAFGRARVNGDHYVVTRRHGAVTAVLQRRTKGGWPHPGLPEPEATADAMTVSNAFGSLYGGQ